MTLWLWGEAMTLWHRFVHWRHRFVHWIGWAPSEIVFEKSTARVLVIRCVVCGKEKELLQ